MTELASVETAHDAYLRYRAAFQADSLTQGEWHATDGDGRELACALGVLGPNVASPRDCPASVMPRWLAQMVPWFFDNQSFDDAKAWGLAFYEQLDRLGGQVPFSAAHDWHANVTTVYWAEWAKLKGRDDAPHLALQALHRRALAGEVIAAGDWRPVLRTAYANAYAYDDADAYANAYAYAGAYASAYANADAYADAYAAAYADADADAYAYDNDRRARITRLAKGMVEVLSRVAV